MDAALRRLSRGGPPGDRWPARTALLHLLSLLRRQRQASPAPRSPAPALLLPLLLLPFHWGRPAGAATSSETTIDGRTLSVSSLREAESRSFTCLAAAPSLAWYLNGELQETNVSSRLLATAGGGGSSSSTSTFVVTARRLDRQLDCTATSPATGRVSTASVLLNVQFKPDIVKVDARVREASEPGVLLVLFVLVQANPPADITWVDQDGQLTVNSSSFLLLDAETYPWLANHTVRVQLRGPAQNLSLSASNAVGIANASVLLSGLWDTQIELPLVALMGAAALAVVMLLSLGLFISRTAKRPAGAIPSAQLPPRQEAHLLRESKSLPPNLWLSDLMQEPESEGQGLPFLPSARRAEETPQGWDRLATAGYICRASSRSSDEIWL